MARLLPWGTVQRDHWSFPEYRKNSRPLSFLGAAYDSPISATKLIDRASPLLLEVAVRRRFELHERIFGQTPLAAWASRRSFRKDVLRHGWIPIGNAVEKAFERNLRITRAVVTPGYKVLRLVQH
jgi:hypothetical protein